VPTGHAFYDYDSKYVPGGSKHEVPAKVSLNIYQKIQTLALKAHQAIGCRGVSRSDFRYDDRHSENGEVVWLEISSQPGLTPPSLLPDIALQLGHSFGELLSWMVEDVSCLRCVGDRSTGLVRPGWRFSEFPLRAGISSCSAGCAGRRVCWPGWAMA